MPVVMLLALGYGVGERHSKPCWQHKCRRDGDSKPQALETEAEQANGQQQDTSEHQQPRVRSWVEIDVEADKRG